MLVLDCLDATPSNVIEVPTESTMQNAIDTAQANDIIQIKGANLGAGWRIPPYVTLRGCMGARVSGAIAFQGSGGVIEGFEVTENGRLVANKTGAYVVRMNRFTGTSAGTEYGVEGSSVDALVSASVVLVVEQNQFTGRALGVLAATRYDTMTHAVDVTVRNNVFAHVRRPVVVSEAGLVGVVNAKVEHNTFHDFSSAIELSSVDRVSKTSGNLFSTGTSAVSGGSTYEVAYSLAWQVTTPAGSPPFSGSFAQGDPRFVDPASDDLRLGAGSLALDRIPNGTVVPSEDFQGCPRPAGAPGAPPMADVGAYESQAP